MDAAATAPQAGAAEAHMGALSQLIQEANHARGLSYQDMANRAIDPESGTKLAKQALQKLVRTPPVNPPSIEQMRAIANGIGRPLRHVQEAVARQWLQYEATELAGYDADVRIIVAHLAGKSPEDVRRWRYMIEAEERARREAGE
ncbi:hypothetical protein [Streptomyces sp. NPDC008137]|uniref:hypothetical protein n=1 Tax=Streptomyces sp. NPDC008137 TaxID=3364813 RepID=UPI0036E37ADD